LGCCKGMARTNQEKQNERSKAEDGRRGRSSCGRWCNDELCGRLLKLPLALVSIFAGSIQAIRRQRQPPHRRHEVCARVLASSPCLAGQAARETVLAPLDRRAGAPRARSRALRDQADADQPDALGAAGETAGARRSGRSRTDGRSGCPLPRRRLRDDPQHRGAAREPDRLQLRMHAATR